MAQWEIRGVRVGVDLTFPAGIGLLGTMGGRQRILLTALACCLIHELGHLFFMAIFGAKPLAVTFYGGGIRITPGVCFRTWEEFVILLAGCGANFLTAAVCALTGGSGDFIRMSLGLGLFNLMPFSYFDGGRAAELILGCRPAWLRAGGIALLGAAAAAQALLTRPSPSLVAVFLLIALSELSAGRQNK